MTETLRRQIDQYPTRTDDDVRVIDREGPVV